MKVLLINPPSFSEARVSRSLMGGYGMPVASQLVYPPLQLAYAAAVLEREGHEAAILDAEAEDLGREAALARARGHGAELIVMPCSQDTFEAELRFCRALGSDRAPRRCLVGPMAYTHLERAFAAAEADFVLVGEPELAVRDLVEAIEQGSLESMPGLARRSGDGFAVSEGSHRIADLDELPFPARHLLDNDLYHYPGDSRRLTTIQASRGCPIDCPFCAYVFTEGRKLRQRSAASIADEMESAHREHDIRLLVFRDPVFTLDRGRVAELCRLLEERSLDLEWICETALRFLDREILERMRRAGCVGLSFGIESANAEMQARYAMNKIVSHQHAVDMVDACRQLGIRTRAFFMLGFPEETEAMRDETVDFAIRLDPSTVQFVPVTLYAGTPLYEELGSEVGEGVYDPSVAHSIKKAYRRFYGRPARLLSELRAPGSLLRKTARYYSLFR